MKREYESPDFELIKAIIPTVIMNSLEGVGDGGGDGGEGGFGGGE